jgi:hypothetical protein
MPHEYKMIVLIFLHNMFKGISINLTESFDAENNQFDISNLSLNQTNEKSILVTAERSLFHYAKCDFYDSETQEFVSPFFPELFRVKNFELKLEAVFDKLKNQRRFQDFEEVSVKNNAKDEMEV